MSAHKRMPTFLHLQESHLVTFFGSHGINATKHTVINNANQDDVVNIIDKNVFIPINNVTVTTITTNAADDKTKNTVENFGCKDTLSLSSAKGIHIQEIGNNARNPHHKEYLYINVITTPANTHITNMNA